MTDGIYDPTHANILSSLDVKGASVYGGTGKDGYVPVLDANGKLDVSTIPIQEISINIDIPELTNTAYVDSGKASAVGYTPTGAINAPYRTLGEAAAAGFSNFILNSGSYGTAAVTFNTTSTLIRIYSTGSSTFNKLTLNGYAAGTKIVFNNISVSDTLLFASTYSCFAKFTGEGSASKVQGQLSDPSSEATSEKYLKGVEIGPDYQISTFVNIDASTISYLAAASRVANDSSVVSGDTVKDATDRLGTRRIRIPKFTADDTGIHVGSTEDIQVTSASSYDYHAIESLGTSLATAANETFYKEDDSPDFSDVTADTVSAPVISATTVSTAKVKFGSTPIYIDSDNFLMIGE